MAWLTGWNYRRKITTQYANIDSNLTWFPLYVKLNLSDMTGKIRSDGYDIRFTKADGETLLYYEREYFNLSGGVATGDFWVSKSDWVLSSSAGTEFYIYYGKSDAADGNDGGNGNVWDSNFMAVWHLKEASNPYYDSTLNNNDSIAGTYPDQADGKIYKGQNFNGSDDYISVGNNASLQKIDSDYNWTISLWGKFDAPDTDAYLLYKNAAWAVDVGTGNANEVRFQDRVGFGQTITTDDPIAGTAAFYYMVLTGTGTTIKIYVNNSESITSSSLTAWDGSANNLYLGRNSAATMDGIIDEIRISDKIREAEWIKFEHANINAGDNELDWESEESAGESLIKVKDEQLQINEDEHAPNAMKRIIEEVLQFVEEKLRIRTLVRIINEAINLIENIVKKLTGQELLEVINEDLYIYEIRKIPQAINEVLQAIEGRLNIRGLVRILSESLQFIESKLNLRGINKLIAEAVQIIETKLNPRELIRIMAETVQVVESKLNLRIMKRIINEAQQLIEGKIKLSNLIRAIDEELRIYEIRKIPQVINEAVSLVENTVRKLIELMIVRVINEPLQLIESKLGAMNLGRILNEGVQLIESRLGFLALKRVIGETINVIEEKLNFSGLKRFINETLNIQEAKNTAINFIRLILETLRFQEGTIGHRAMNRIINEVVNIAEIIGDLVQLAIQFIERLFKGWLEKEVGIIGYLERPLNIKGYLEPRISIVGRLRVFPKE